MKNFRVFLITALALSSTSSLTACISQSISGTLPSATHLNKNQTDGKVRHSKVRLSFREQKPGTEAQFQRERQVQQELLEKQAELKKAGTPAAIAINKADLNRSDVAITSFFEKPILTEKNVVNAYLDSTTDANIVGIALKFDAAGSKTFAALTKKLAGTGRAVGIFLNDRLISNPFVSSHYSQTGITGGSAVITGNFNAQDAQDLVAQLNAK